MPTLLDLEHTASGLSETRRLFSTPPLPPRRRRRFAGIRAALNTWLEIEPPVCTIGLSERGSWPKNQKALPGLLASCLFHFAVLFLLVRIPLSWAARQLDDSDDQIPPVIYELHYLTLPRSLPALASGGPGGNPGEGNRPEAPSMRGSTSFDPRVTVIAKQNQPTNDRQTVLQALSPEQVKIKMELHLPSVVLGSGTSPVPTPADTAPKQPSITVPKVEIPKAIPPKPSDVMLSPAAAAQPLLALATTPLPPPPPEPPKPAPPSRPELTDLPGSNAARLLALQVNPAPLSDSIRLQPGDRPGSFSISPIAGWEGSPRGITSGSFQGGRDGKGASSGDASVGVGPAAAGGGGTGTGSVEATGSGTSGGIGAGTLPPFNAESLVYPVAAPPKPRHSLVVVTAGPAGGGGLHVYGVLHSGRIYSTYLPMPGQNWVLQYCDPQSGQQSVKNRSKAVEIRIGTSLFPPTPAEQFDFRRPSLSGDPASAVIILHGIIEADGSVRSLEVLQGVEKVTDAAAMAAFQRWKFKPAVRAGKPVAVEVLVGIPLGNG